MADSGKHARRDTYLTIFWFAVFAVICVYPAAAIKFPPLIILVVAGVLWFGRGMKSSRRDTD